MPTRTLDNQLAARLLFDHGLATREQILECWPDISPERDIAAVLVDKGILAPETYRQLVAYLETQGGGPPANPGEEDGKAPREEEEKETAPAAGRHPERPEAAVVSPEPAEEPSWTPAAAIASQEPAGSVSGKSAWTELLAHARASGASDLHLSAGNPVLVRRNGSLQAITGSAMTREQVRRWVEQALGPEEAAEFDRKGDLELVRDHGGARYRCTFLNQRRGCDITVRVIPDRIRTFEETGLPESCRELTRWAQGMVLVTGPVGCGKSTTLAALVEMVNRDRRDHIITLEEPIEYVYRSSGCRITQREVGRHTRSRDAALRAALREDPDILVIAELRDMETIRLAVSAAETGHLVFGTMNTANASRTIYRLIDSFPPEEQAVVRSMISESLRGVISQQLLPLADGTGMVPAFEVLLVNSAVSNMIRKEEIHQLGTAMLTGKGAGMVLLDDSLKALVEAGLVDPREAAARATMPKDFERYMGRGSR